MIHQFKQNGVNVVLDVYSGAVHTVDDVVYDVVSEIDRVGWEVAKKDSFACLSSLDNTYSRQDIQEAMDDVGQSWSRRECSFPAIPTWIWRRRLETRRRLSRLYVSM